MTDIVSDIPSGSIYGIYPNILSGIISGVLSGIYSDILSGIYSGILFGMCSGPGALLAIGGSGPGAPGRHPELAEGEGGGGAGGGRR
jgi:hypothetical protein